MAIELRKKVALITGSARRVGRIIAQQLHAQQMHIILHCRTSKQEATALEAELNTMRPNSCSVVYGDLSQVESVKTIARAALACYGHIDLLVHNASSFYPKKIAEVTEEDWQELIGSNLKGPFFLSQQLYSSLQSQKGSIISILDIYANSPLPDFPVYSIAKAGHAMMVKSLALELAPDVRVNGIAPGAILWPENVQLNAADLTSRLEKIPLARKGDPLDIAEAVLFLARSNFITGQILAVDGGRSLRI